MPPPTDHNARRAELVQYAIDLIAAGGLEAATVRRLAGLTGFSTTAVTHYFSSKSALLGEVFEFCAERAQTRVDQVIRNDPRDVRGCLIALSAIGDEARKAWQVNIAFWQQSQKEAEFRQRQSWWMSKAEKTLLDAIGERQLQRQPLIVARSLLAAVMGLAARATLEEGFADAAQIAILDAVLDQSLA